MLTIRCPGCSKAFKVQDRFAGKRMRCRECASVIQIPAHVPTDAAAARPPSREDVSVEEDPSGRNKELEETAVLTDAEREALERERARSGKPARTAGARGRRETRRIVGAKVGARRGVGGRSRGAGPAPRGRSRRAAPGEGEAGEGPPEKKTGVLIAGGSLAVVAIGIVIWAVFFTGPGASDEPEPEGTPIAAENGEEGTEEAEGAEDAEGAPTGEVPEGEAAAAEKAPEEDKEPVDVLAVIPDGASVLAHLDVPGILGLAPLFGMGPEEVQANLASTAQAAGFDPAKDLKSIYLALFLTDLNDLMGLVPNPQNPAAMGQDAWAVANRACIFMEGSFEEEKILAAGREAKSVGEEPMEVENFKAYPLLEGGQQTGYFSVINEGQMLLAGTEVFEAVAYLEHRGGKAVKYNPKFRSLTNDFEAEEAFWLAVDIPEEMSDFLRTNLKENPTSSGILTAMSVETPPTLTGVFLAVGGDPEGGLGVRLNLRCGEKQGALDLMKIISGFKMMPLPPLVKELLTKLTGNVEEDQLNMALAFSKEDLEQIKQMAAATAPGGPGGLPPGGVPMEVPPAGEEGAPGEGIPTLEDLGDDDDDDDEEEPEEEPGEEPEEELEDGDDEGDEEPLEEPDSGDGDDSEEESDLEEIEDLEDDT